MVEVLSLESVDVDERAFVVVWVTRAGRAAVYVCCNTSREGVGSKSSEPGTTFHSEQV